MASTTAAAAATGGRAWLATRTWAWVTETQLKRASLLLIGVATGLAAVGAS